MRELNEIKKDLNRCDKERLFDHNIALIGFMGTGKSTVSKYLRDMLAMKEVDVDAMIVI
jgi:shikimate kinase